MAIGLAALAAAPGAGSFVRRTGLAAPRTHSAFAAAPRSHLAGLVCHKALQPTDRSVSIRAVMRPVTGTERMHMRFELLSKSSTGGVQSVPGNGLDSWISPPDTSLGQRPGDVWIIKDFQVANLPGPALYHYRVSFRWIGTAGRVISTRVRSSASCYQPELRPDLLVSSITVQPIPGKPAKAQYVAAIENAGLTGAGLFAVTFAPGGGTVTMTKAVQHLGPGATRHVTFVGPACTASTAPTIVVDPNQTVPEYNYANNALTVPPACPPVTVASVVAG